MEERKVNAGVAVILVDIDLRVLMGKRKGSHGAGSWSFPGGWMRHGEMFRDTAKRELMEETGIELMPYHDPEVFGTSTTLFKDKDVQSVTVLLLVLWNAWNGISVSKEPDKLEGDWKWFRIDQLPPVEQLFEPLRNMFPPLTAQLQEKLKAFGPPGRRD